MTGITGPGSIRAVLLMMLAMLFTCPVAGASLEMTLQFPPPRIVETGDDSVRVELDGSGRVTRAGAPMLPQVPVRLLLPYGEEVAHISVEQGTRHVLDGTWFVAPAQRPHSLSSKKVEPTRPDPKIYSIDTRWPAEGFSRPMTSRFRGFGVTTLKVYPVRYRPLSGQLEWVDSLRVVVTTKPSDDWARSSAPLIALDHETIRAVKQMVDNPEAAEAYLHLHDRAIPGLDNACSIAHGMASAPVSGRLAAKFSEEQPGTPSATGTSLPEWDYLIVTDSGLIEPFQSLANFKTSRGIKTRVVTLAEIYDQFTEGDEQNRIRSYIIQAYQEWGIRYVLLGGDTEIVPHRGLLVSEIFTLDPDCPADIYYGGLDGTWNDDNDQFWGEHDEADYLPEVCVGRAPVDSTAEAANFVNKVMRYQASPVVEDCTRGLMIGEETWWEVKAKDYKEEIRLGTDLWGFTTEGFPDWFEVETIYDTDGVWDAETELLPLLNDGPNLINHAGHADTYVVMKFEDFMYTDEHFTNDGVDEGLSIIYSQGCFCGSFDNRTADFYYMAEDCVAEEMLTMPTGAVACVMNSRNGWGSFYDTNGPSQYFDREFFDALFSEGIQHLGAVCDDSKMDNVWIVDDPFWQYCYYTLNLLGDPEMSVWTAEPQLLTVVHPAEVAMGNIEVEIEVQLNGQPVEGARVCLYQERANGEYARGETDGNGTVWMDIHPATVDSLFVSVTAPNALPYLGVITPRSISAWVGYGEHRVDDDTTGSSHGDGNSITNNGETIELAVGLLNYGMMQTAHGVEAVLITEDPLITLIEPWAEYGTLSPGQTKFPDQPFILAVSGDTPDRHEAEFRLHVNDTHGSEWKSLFRLPVTSPAMVCHDVTISDGGNNFLQPGEEADLMLTVFNAGERPVHGMTARVASGDPRIEVLESDVSFGDVGAGETAGALGPCRIRIASAATTPCSPNLRLHFRGDWDYNTQDSFSVQVVSLGLGEDMENGALNWSHQAVKWTADQWHLTTQLAAGGHGRSWKCGPEYSWDGYSFRMDAGLVSPPFGLEPHSVLTFWHAIDAEMVGSYHQTAIDGGLVEITTDGGESWEQLNPFNGYTEILFPFYGPIAYPQWTRCFSGHHMGRHESMYLDDRQGVAQIRFRFGTDMFKGNYLDDFRGWFVDNVAVRPADELVVSLNPSCLMILPRGEASITGRYLLGNHTDAPVSAWAMAFVGEDPYQGGPISWVTRPRRIALEPGQVIQGEIDWPIPATQGWGEHRYYFRFSPTIAGTPLVEDSFPFTVYGE